MPTLEELEQRVTRLETLYEDVLKERMDHIASRLDQIYEKTERDKTEILTKTERDKTEILTKTERDKTEILTKTAEILAKTESDKAELRSEILSKTAEILAKTDRDKRELIQWMIGLMVGFSTLIITALWAILSFALKQ